MTSFRFSRGLLTIAAVAGMIAFGMAPSARADLIVRAITGGMTYTLIDVPSGTAGVFSGNVDGFTIQLETASSNSPGTPALADLLSSTLSITNVSSATGNIILQATDEGFTAPSTAPLLLTENLSGTVVVPDATNTVTFQGWVDTSNAAFGMGGPTPGPISTNITGLPPGTTVFDATSSTVITGNLTTPYSLTKEKDIHLSTGSTVNFVTSLDVTAAVPEPATLAAAFSALPFLGFGAWRRLRRKAS